MFKSKINLFGQEWIDTVFEGRDKRYGAYDLRSREAAVTVKALVIGTVLFCLIISSPLIIKQFGGHTKRYVLPLENITVVELLALPENPVTVEIPPAAPEQQEDRNSFTSPVAAPEESAGEIIPQEQLNADSAGDEDIDALWDEGPIAGGIALLPAGGTSTAGEEVHQPHSVEVQPQYPGGFRKLMEYVMASLKDVKIRNAKEVRMMFDFVVEKDGSLSNVVTVGNGGQPEAAAKAAGVLSSCDRWVPGTINGEAVRVAYTVPIIIIPQ